MAEMGDIVVKLRVELDGDVEQAIRAIVRDELDVASRKSSQVAPSSWRPNGPSMVDVPPEQPAGELKYPVAIFRRVDLAVHMFSHPWFPDRSIEFGPLDGWAIAWSDGLLESGLWSEYEGVWGRYQAELKHSEVSDA